MGSADDLVPTRRAAKDQGVAGSDAVPGTGLAGVEGELLVVTSIG